MRLLNSPRTWGKNRRNVVTRGRCMTPYRRNMAFETLEDRRMLSTITWTNRGMSSDGFDAVFGASAAVARANADAAFATWARVIQDFNNGTNNVDISLSVGGVGLGGSGGVTDATIVGGRPTSGTIGLAGGNDGHGSGYYLDPTPYDSSEFDGTITNVFAGNAKPGTAAANGADLYTLVLLETTHVLGTSKNPSLKIWTSGLLSNTNIPIPAGREEAGPGAGGLNNTYWLFSGASGKVLFNGSANTGNPADTFNAVHSASTTVPPVVYNGSTYYGSEDAANSVWSNGERYIPSGKIAGVFHDAYGYTINQPSQFGTFYTRLDADGTLNIKTPAGASPDILDLQISGGNLLVTLGLGIPVLGADPNTILSVFPTNAINNIKINMGDGSDTVTIHSLYNSIPIALDMGAGSGFDVLNVWGGAGYDAITVSNPSLVSTGVTLTSFNGVESLNLYTNGGDADVSMPDAGSALSATINGLGGPEFINLHSLNAFIPLSIFGNGGDDTITIDPLGGFDIIQPRVSVYGGDGNDTLAIASSNADLHNATITFDGGTSFGAVGDRIIFNDSARTYNLGYDIAPTLVVRSGLGAPLSYNFSNTERIVVNAGTGNDSITLRNGVTATVIANGNGGDDNFIVGGGNMTGFQPQTFVGGDGNDTITFDDSNDFTARIWDVRPDEVLFGGLISLATTGFESVAIRAGINADEITFAGNFFQTLSVDGSFGSDTFKFGFNNVPVNFFAPATITGGAGDESFIWQYGSTNWWFGLGGTSTYPLFLDGGAGFNSLSINETTRANAANYQLYADRFYANDAAGFPRGADFTFDNMGTIGITLNNLANSVAAYGVSSDIAVGQQVSLLLQGGNDAVTLYPRDAQGNLTINGNFGIFGGAGTDTLTIQDAASMLPIDYKFQNLSGVGTTNIAGLGAGGFGAFADIESIIVNAGAGSDTFDIETFQSGSALAIHGGDGNDLLNFGTTTIAGITSLASFLFNGQDGYDTYNLDNSTNSSAWTYTRNLGTLVASSNMGASYFLNDSSVELTQISAGDQVDIFNVNSVATGTQLVLNAGGALDGLDLTPVANNLEAIQGRVVYNGQAGGGNIGVRDALDTTGDTVHLTATSLGAGPGDNLFGPGGSLVFSDLVNFGAFPGITLSLGSGADTVFAQPLTTARVTVNGNNPTTAPGDRLQLLYDHVTNPMFTPNGAGAGAYTFDGAQSFAYTGFETTDAAYRGDFDRNGSVGAADLAVLEAAFGLAVPAGDGADANANGLVNGGDFLDWQRGFGAGAPVLAAASHVSNSAYDIESVVSSSGNPQSLSPALTQAVVDTALAVDSPAESLASAPLRFGLAGILPPGRPLTAKTPALRAEKFVEAAVFISNVPNREHFASLQPARSNHGLRFDQGARDEAFTELGDGVDIDHIPFLFV